MLNSLRFWTFGLFLLLCIPLFAKTSFVVVSGSDSALVEKKDFLATENHTTKIFIKEGTTVSNLASISSQGEVIFVSTQKESPKNKIAKAKSNLTPKIIKVEPVKEKQKVAKIRKLNLRKCPHTDSFSTGSYNQMRAVPAANSFFNTGNLYFIQGEFNKYFTFRKHKYYYLNQFFDSYILFNSTIRPPPVSSVIS